MTTQRDEQLAAWLDGALPPVEAEAFAAEVARDPSLAAQAEAWRAHDRQISDALVAAERPIDDALLARLGLNAAPAAAPAAGPAYAPAAANDNPRWPARRWLAGGTALAASVAAAVLLTLHGTVSGDPLSDALDRTASQTSAQLADGRTIMPTLTVRAADGRWCREFREGAENALACRTGGRWSIEARAHGAAAGDAGGIAVAGGADPAPLDSAYAKLKASDPLSAAEERRLLANRWQ